MKSRGTPGQKSNPLKYWQSPEASPKNAQTFFLLESLNKTQDAYWLVFIIVENFNSNSTVFFCLKVQSKLSGKQSCFGLEAHFNKIRIWTSSAIIVTSRVTLSVHRSGIKFGQSWGEVYDKSNYMLPYETDFGETWNVFVQTERRRDELQMEHFHWNFITSYIIVNVCEGYAPE